ncbi:MAG: zf-HC2 domain-containing protein [Chlorobi bacterium]|nr:zf-HC2 domain-containing protein [Chlorobiota bacterium]
MNCKQTHKKIIPYINGELNPDTIHEIKAHLNSCKSCNTLYNEVIKTMSIPDKRKEITPNPFLYTRIKEQLTTYNNGAEKKAISVSYKKLLQPIIVSVMLVFAIFSGIGLGNAYFSAKPKNKIIIEKTTAYYLNDLKQERLEMTILNN